MAPEGRTGTGRDAMIEILDVVCKGTVVIIGGAL
jgi:hypothetical protein